MLRAAVFDLLGHDIKGLSKALLTTEKAHYDRILYNFDQLGNLSSTDGPKFVYAHMVAPHFPYVFNSDGSFNEDENARGAYTNEIAFLDKLVLVTVKQILAESKVPPVILIQSDHGLAESVRNANLMAYYLPNGGEKNLYPDLSPVNSFRIVFNQYFGANYPLLPDIARSASYQDPYNFTVVDYPCPVK